MKVLTKSRFKQALECPNKLYYTRKKEYANQSEGDPFLLALASGGFQVEEYARMHFPNGELIEGKDGEYEYLAKRTAELLKNEDVVIYEAAFLVDNLFVRTDILIKQGDTIEVVEVKSKTYDPNDQNFFVGKKGGLNSGWKSYLFDIAFQAHVVQLAYPDAQIRASLMLADKTKVATTNGLHQNFRIRKNADHRTGVEIKNSNITDLGESVLSKVPVDEIIQDIFKGIHKYPAQYTFHECVEQFRNHYLQDKYFNYPVSWSCKSCEFQASEEDEQNGLKSGLKECFTTQLHWVEKDFEKPSIFELWNFRKGAKLFEDGKVFLHDLTDSDVGLKPLPGLMSSSERQWIQVEKSINQDFEPYVLKEELKEEMAQWQFPLNFIDFETSTVPLPFHAGRRPYEQVAFQFSHHTLESDGTIEHKNEFLLATPGVFPNFEFVRVLKKALEQNHGTVFRYSNHENSILVTIHDQLKASSESDKEELCAFIKTITQTNSKRRANENWIGDRNMVDLCEVVKKYYYNLHFGGSNSLKVVLPATLKSSKLVQEKYGKSLRENGVGSTNFENDHIWLQKIKGEILNPYKILPPVFEGWDEQDLFKTQSEMEDLADGGAALTAYGKLQYTDMDKTERKAIEAALLKYCELDTLAMVMLYEHLVELTTV